MEDDAEYMFRKTAGVMLKLDDNDPDKIRFMLPNGHLYKYKLVNIIQQIQINEKIKSYTNGKKWIEWSMLGIKNVKDVIERFEKYCNQFENTFFNKMKFGKHIKDIEILGNEIIFNLDGNRMKQLNSKWEYKIANELMKYCVLHNFEIVIVNKKRTKQNNNNNNKKNNNKTSTDRQHKNKNENTYRNIQIQRLDYVLDEWDKEMDILDKESGKRQNETCNVMNEKFRISIDIVDGFGKKLNLLNEMKQGIDIELLIKLNERNSKIAKTFALDLNTIENKLELEKVNLLNQEIKMKEGCVTEENLDKQEMDLKTQQRKEKDRTYVIDKLIKTCESTFLIICDYDKEIQTIKFDQVNEEWLKLNELIKNYDGNLFTANECLVKKLMKEKSGLTLQKQKMKIKNVKNDNKLISTSTLGIVGDSIVGKDIRKTNLNLKVVVSGSNNGNVKVGKIDGNLLSLETSAVYNTESTILSTLSVAVSLMYDNKIRKINNTGNKNSCEKIREIGETLLNFALVKIPNEIDSIALNFCQMDMNVQGYYDYG